MPVTTLELILLFPPIDIMTVFLQNWHHRNLTNQRHYKQSERADRIVSLKHLLRQLEDPIREVKTPHWIVGIKEIWNAESFW